MFSFPLLKTGAVAQYPAKRVIHFSNKTVRFIDGTEQRYRDCGRAFRRWEIALEQLDDGELTALETFFRAIQGRAGYFTFIDPWDETAYANCSLADDTLTLTATGEAQARGRLTVVENPD